MMWIEVTLVLETGCCVDSKKRATAQSGVHYEFLIVLWQGLRSNFYDRKKNSTIKSKNAATPLDEASPRRTLRSSSEKQKDGKYAHLRPQLADVMHGF
ncbi:hypothetical protein EG335_06330 [Pectobacterium versatile]|uniref:hypothetical protein n=1 Tax=Pectobacterium versatile TaxID=2488639 RepID=UPI0010E07AAA|nr:hypothetical protein [Pectobacterium versatile]TAI99314.1 hypothetical protein EG335_06330 [Pectobacterium versatile]